MRATATLLEFVGFVALSANIENFAVRGASLSADHQSEFQVTVPFERVHILKGAKDEERESPIREPVSLLVCHLREWVTEILDVRSRS
jgi:hypothetical protein